MSPPFPVAQANITQQTAAPQAVLCTALYKEATSVENGFPL